MKKSMTKANQTETREDIKFIRSQFIYATTPLEKKLSYKFIIMLDGIISELEQYDNVSSILDNAISLSKQFRTKTLEVKPSLSLKRKRMYNI